MTITERCRQVLLLLANGFFQSPANGRLREHWLHHQPTESTANDANSPYRQLQWLTFRLFALAETQRRAAIKDVMVENQHQPLPCQRSEYRPRVFGYQHFRVLSAEFLYGETSNDEAEFKRETNGPRWPTALMDDRRIPDLANAPLNEKVFDAAWHAFTDDNPQKDGDAWRSDVIQLVQELGAAYLNILQSTLVLNPRKRIWVLKTQRAPQRRGNGCYYTPPSLVDFLVRETVGPLCEEILAAAFEACGYDAVERIPKDVSLLPPEVRAKALQVAHSKTVCDPSCGVGTFLLATAEYLANIMAQWETGTNYPSEDALIKARRQVISRQVFGVDIDPLSVELCRLGLWFALREPHRPLGTLHAHIQCGNSLLGATPACLARGIPGAAYALQPGDNQIRSRNLRYRNQKETRARRQIVFSGQTKQTRSVITRSPSAGDIWCAAFLTQKNSDVDNVPTSANLWHWNQGVDLPAAMRQNVAHVSARHVFFHWHERFPQVFTTTQDENILDSEISKPEDNQSPGWGNGFDVCIGNPPFHSAITRGLSAATSTIVRILHPRVRGAADAAYFFLDLATQLTRPGGKVGLLLPRAVLNTPTLQQWRQSPRADLCPNTLYVPERANFFAGATVFVAGVVLGNRATCRVSRDPDPKNALFSTSNLPMTGSWTNNWWHGLIASTDPAGMFATPLLLTSGFEVHASMTAGDAYQLQSALVDQRDEGGLKLVTTGLIAPHCCHWGQMPCRYLKRDYTFPRLREDVALPDSLRRRLQAARRPKIIVAGLSARIECFVDESGEYAGAVSTYSIFHSEDNRQNLHQLCNALLTHEATARFRAELGGNALGGGNITMKKTFLRSLM